MIGRIDLYRDMALKEALVEKHVNFARKNVSRRKLYFLKKLSYFNLRKLPSFSVASIIILKLNENSKFNLKRGNNKPKQERGRLKRRN